VSQDGSLQEGLSAE